MYTYTHVYKHEENKGQAPACSTHVPPWINTAAGPGPSAAMLNPLMTEALLFSVSAGPVGV